MSSFKCCPWAADPADTRLRPPMGTGGARWQPCRVESWLRTTPTTDTARVRAGVGARARFQDPRPRRSPCRPGMELRGGGLSTSTGGFSVTFPADARACGPGMCPLGEPESVSPDFHWGPGQGPGGWGQGLRVWRQRWWPQESGWMDPGQWDRTSPHGPGPARLAGQLSLGPGCVSDA